MPRVEKDLLRGIRGWASRRASSLTRSDSPPYGLCLCDQRRQGFQPYRTRPLSCGRARERARASGSSTQSNTSISSSHSLAVRYYIAAPRVMHVRRSWWPTFRATQWPGMISCSPLVCWGNLFSKIRLKIAPFPGLFPGTSLEPWHFAPRNKKSEIIGHGLCATFQYIPVTSPTRSRPLSSVLLGIPPKEFPDSFPYFSLFSWKSANSYGRRQERRGRRPQAQ